MLFMVVEQFKDNCVPAVGKRFQDSGRMLPDGVTYLASWVDSAHSRCFQLMETSSPELLNAWTSQWNDLIDFEIVPVQTSSDFWSEFG